MKAMNFAMICFAILLVGYAAVVVGVWLLNGFAWALITAGFGAIYLVLKWYEVVDD